jgi:hypothetical protein
VGGVIVAVRRESIGEEKANMSTVLMVLHGALAVLTVLQEL